MVSQNDSVSLRSTMRAEMRMWSKHSCPSGKTVSVASGSGGEASIGGGTKDASCDFRLSRH